VAENAVDARRAAAHTKRFILRAPLSLHLY